jgi:hypothetical protein
MIRVVADKHCIERNDIVFRTANFAGELSEGIIISFFFAFSCAVTSSGVKVQGKEDSR